MRRTQLGVAIAGLGLVLAGTSVSMAAHHAFAAEFDANKPIEMRGTLTRMEWINPHVWLHMDVKMPNGTVENWAFEAGTPNNLFRRGFTKESLKPGIEIVVDGYQAKNGTKRANGRNLTLPNGSTLFMGSSGTGAPPPELKPENYKGDLGTGQSGPGAKK